MIQNFYDLKIWQKANSLAKDIYELTKNFPNEEKYGLTSQIRRASTSIGANIAEGFGKHYIKDKIKFMHQARGSLYEVQNFIFFSKDLKLMNEKQARKIFSDYQGLSKGLNVFINRLGNVNKN
ncbi:MAG: four helix bundle protein [Patescibacteria group bacterium]